MASQTRKQTLLRIAELVGESLQIESANRGWPGIGVLRLASGAANRIALHVGPVGLSHRKRDSTERRFQNPGQGVAVESQPEIVPILLGLWQEEGARAVLVAFDATRRVGRATRFSLFCPLWLLERAESTGWAEHMSASREPIVAFHPGLLPVYIEMHILGVAVPADRITSLLDASGMVDIEAAAPADRARRAALTLVRNAMFRERVVNAYHGLCAMCGLNLGLCQGAHIYPVSAPGSPDREWNGLALCGNHHAAFDRHFVYVEPDSRSIRLHPTVEAHARSHKASEVFVATTLSELREPESSGSRPRAEMFAKRYSYFGDQYDWAT